jgi:hypothetical protein
MTQSMTKLGRATRAGAFAAMLGIIGVIAVMASAKTARAWDPQASEASRGDEADRQEVPRGYAVGAQPGAYASVHRDRRGGSTPATQKNFQDIR